MSHRFAIDSLAVRGARMSGWGWFLDDAAPAEEITLHWRDQDGDERALHCPQLGSRPDLATAFPGLPHAAAGGFMLHGRVPPGVDLDAFLQAKLSDGRIIDIPLAGFPRAVQELLAPAETGWQRGYRLLRTRQWASLLQMLGHQWRKYWPAAPASLRSNAPLSSGLDSIVIFDHAMGGGANHFRQERIAQWRAEGNEVVLVTPDLVTLDYIAQVFDTRGKYLLRRFDDLDACLDSLGNFSRAVVNDLVSFDDPLKVLRWVSAQKASGSRIRFYLHDFHAVCPTWTLTAASGGNEALVDATTLAARVPGGAPFLGLLPSLDLRLWRAQWASFLAGCDDIVAFSSSSLQLLRKAYPALDLDHARIEPHSLAYLGPTPPPFRPNLGGLITIAVVGNISRLKGADIVRDMATIIEQEAVAARIVVLGSVDGLQPSPVVRHAGAYTPAELPAILAREGVSVAFLPSIVHETFSYVTAELMHFGVPLAVFDLGAPAERVRHYPLGCIVPEVNARTALHSLIELHHRLSASAEQMTTDAHAGSP